MDVIGARWVTGTLIAFELMHEVMEDAGKRRINGSARHPSALCRCEVAGFKPTCFFPSRPPPPPPGRCCSDDPHCYLRTRDTPARIPSPTTRRRAVFRPVLGSCIAPGPLPRHRRESRKVSK